MKIVDKIKVMFAQRRNTNNTIKMLESLNDHQLEDIGLCRGDIRKAAEGILMVHRSVRDNV